MPTNPPKGAVHEAVYTVRTHEIDHRKQMTVPALVRLMQEAAMQHVFELKLSVRDLEPEGVAWVLTRLQLEISCLPTLQETITVRTCPTGLEQILTYRNFRIFNARGECIAEAVTHWVLMDTQTRRLRPVPKWIAERFAVLIPKQYDGLHPSRHRLPVFTQTDHQTAFRVRWHDLDFNLHLNNTNYILYLLEGLPYQWLSENRLKRLDIVYKAEVGVEETFQVRIQQLMSGQFLHQMVQGQEEKVPAEMISEWQ